MKLPMTLMILFMIIMTHSGNTACLRHPHMMPIPDPPKEYFKTEILGKVNSNATIDYYQEKVSENKDLEPYIREYIKDSSDIDGLPKSNDYRYAWRIMEMDSTEFSKSVKNITQETINNFLKSCAKKNTTCEMTFVKVDRDLFWDKNTMLQCYKVWRSFEANVKKYGKIHHLAQQGDLENLRKEFQNINTIEEKRKLVLKKIKFPSSIFLQDNMAMDIPKTWPEKPDHKTVLHYALMSGDLNLVKYLLSFFDENVRDERIKRALVNHDWVEGTTPLQRAVLNGQENIVKFILNAFDDSRAEKKKLFFRETVMMIGSPQYNCKALTMAARLNNTPIVKLLMNFLEDIYDNRREFAEKVLYDSHVGVDQFLPLHWAAKHDNLEMVKILTPSYTWAKKSYLNNNYTIYGNGVTPTTLALQTNPQSRVARYLATSFQKYNDMTEFRTANGLQENFMTLL